MVDSKRGAETLEAGTLGTATRPLRVAVVGAGPSGFYAVESLQNTEGLHVRVDVFDRLPTPFGLLRGGVAPDHQKVKGVANVYENIALQDGFRFFGNVVFGRDLLVEDLCQHYDQILFAVGAEGSRKLGIPGEDLQGVFFAGEFVGWYNAHPAFADLNFELGRSKSVAVVGNGNVSMDVTRILVEDAAVLEKTDIADYALAELSRHRVERVHLLGRRGPAQAAFSPRGVRELAGVSDVDLVVRPEDADLDDLSQAWLAQQPGRAAQKNVKFLSAQARLSEGEGATKVYCRFLCKPVEILGDKAGRVRAIRVERCVLHADAEGVPRPRGTGEFEEIPVQLVLRAVRFLGVKIPGVPHCDRRGGIPNLEGRVTDGLGGDVVPDQYVVGWAKRGPGGLVGTNGPDAKATVKHMVDDLEGRTAATLSEDDLDTVPALLAARGVKFVDWEDWRRLDAWELEQGERLGKPRHKLGSIEALLALILELRPGSSSLPS